MLHKRSIGIGEAGWRQWRQQDHSRQSGVFLISSLDPLHVPVPSMPAMNIVILSTGLSRTSRISINLLTLTTAFTTKSDRIGQSVSQGTPTNRHLEHHSVSPHIFFFFLSSIVRDGELLPQNFLILFADSRPKCS